MYSFNILEQLSSCCSIFLSALDTFFRFASLKSINKHQANKTHAQASHSQAGGKIDGVWSVDTFRLGPPGRDPRQRQ